MRFIGVRPVLARYIGTQHVIGRFEGDRLVSFRDYLHEGLIHHFDGRNNTGTGHHDPDATTWVDLVTGIQATMEDVHWQDFGVAFTVPSSKVFYSGQSVEQYTIFNTHRVAAITGLHPRIFGERPYPTLYISSTSARYGFYAQGFDTAFRPYTSPTLGQTLQIAIRFAGTGTIDLFYNGILTATIQDVVLYPTPVPIKYLGCHEANDRTLNGEIYEHLVYNRPLTNEDIFGNFLVSRERYQI